MGSEKPPEQTDLPATLPPSVVKREGPVEYELSRSDDEVGNGRVGVSVSERRSPQVRSVTRRQNGAGEYAPERPLKGVGLLH